MRSTRRAPIAALPLVAACLAGCATLGDRGQPLVPTQHQERVGPFVVFTNQPLAPDEGVRAGLDALRVDVEETLGLRVVAGDHPIEVYILGDRKAFEHFLAFYYPELPQRRAFFIAQGPRRVVYTFRGDRLAEDLRHEATHALLSLAVGDIPLWLDEGLAEYFEDGDARGVNREHLARLPADAAEGWAPRLARLEEIKTVRRMSPLDYRESWAWVHYLLHGPADGRAALLGYLGDLRGGGEVAPLSGRLGVGQDEAASGVLSHLKTVKPPQARPVSKPEVVVRLQDGPIAVDPPPIPFPKPKGPLARFFGRIFP